MLIANVLQPLIDVEEWTLEGLHAVGLSWGLAIVGLTLIVRVALVPLTVRQFRAQRELATHLPELQRLRAEHGNDSDRLREELTAYYNEHSVNPSAALLPVLLQLPIFISLYFLLREDVASGLFEHASFLLIPDITEKAHGAALALLIALYLTTQLASGMLSTRHMQSRPRKLFLALPLLFVGAAVRFPAGLLLYWITSSTWALGQQLVLARLRAREAVADLPASVRSEESAAWSSPPPKRPHPVSRKKRERRSRRGGRAA